MVGPGRGRTGVELGGDTVVTGRSHQMSRLHADLQKNKKNPKVKTCFLHIHVPTSNGQI